MGILKRHYEKIGLGVCLVLLLAFSANMLLDLWSATDLPDDGPPPPGAGTQTVDRLVPKDFNAIALVQNPDVKWTVSQRAGGQSLFYPGEFMICANPECNHWLPYRAKSCPWCGTNQISDIEAPPPEGEDSDDDGILDTVEAEYEFLSSNDRGDAWLDPDGDWFTNLEEVGATVTEKTDPSDNTDHPLLAHNLRLAGIQKERFDIVFQNLITGGDEVPKERWDLALKVVTDGVWKTRFANLGDTVKGYKIVDVEKKTETVFSEQINAEVEKDVSEITLEDNEGGKIVLKLGEESTAGVRVRLIFYKSATDPREAVMYSLKGNEVLTLKDVNGQTEKYNLRVASGNRVIMELVGQPERRASVDMKVPEKFQRQRPVPFEEPAPADDFGPAPRPPGWTPF